MVPPPSILSAFVTLFVTIGPIETAVLFASLTAGVHRPERRGLATRSIVIAGFMLALFALGGTTALSLLHVSLPAFRVAGGLLLFLQALTLTFASPGLSSISEGERRDAQEPGDIAVFPLAFPVIAGPGSLSAVVLLMAGAPEWIDGGWVLLVLLACLGLTYRAMFVAEALVRRLGRTGADVVGRVSGPSGGPRGPIRLRRTAPNVSSLARRIFPMSVFGCRLRRTKIPRGALSTLDAR